MTNHVVRAPNIKHIQIGDDELRHYEKYLTGRMLITLPVGQWVVIKIENNIATLQEIGMMMEC